MGRGGSAMATIALCIGAGGGAVVHAQGDPGEERSQEDARSGSKTLDRIVVTARKRAESLQDVPVAVSVIGSDAIQAAELSDIKELQFLTPSLTLRDGNVDRGVGFVIRGVGTRSFDTGVESSVNVVVDGVVNGLQAQSIAELADIERIEVLRGPQGTLFGKNSSSGVINIVTKDPSDTFEGKLNASYGSNNELKLGGSISGPLADRIGGRLTFYRNSNDGFVKNISTGPENETEEWGVRGKLKFDLDGQSELMLIGNMTERDSNCCYWIARSAPSSSALANWISPVVASPTNDTINLANDFSSFNDIESKGLSVHYERDMGSYEIVAIGAWTDWESLVNTDVDSGPADLIDINGGLFTSENKTLEVRAQSNEDSGVNWVLGAFYSDQVNTGNQDIGSNTAALIGSPPGVSNFGTLTIFEENISDIAVFADVSTRISESFVVGLGARYTSKSGDGKTENVLLPGYDIPAPFRPVSPLKEVDVDDSGFGGRVVLEWHPNDDQMIYTSFVRGWKGPAIVPAQAEEIKAEIPTGIELGYRGTFANGRIQTAANIFSTEYKDFQAQSLALDSGGNLRFFLNSAGKLETKGVELEFNGLVTDNITLSAQYSYIDAEFTDYDDAPCYSGQNAALGCVVENGIRSQDLTGEPLPLSPKNSFTFSGRYDFKLGSVNGFSNLGYAWRDSTAGDLNNPAHEIESYGLLNGKIGFVSPDGNLTVAIWGKNLLDEFYVTRIFDVTGGGISHYISPNSKRRIGVSASLNF